MCLINAFFVPISNCIEWMLGRQGAASFHETLGLAAELRKISQQPAVSFQKEKWEPFRTLKVLLFE